MMTKEPTDDVSYKTSVGNFSNMKSGIYFISNEGKYSFYSRKSIATGIIQLEKLKSITK